MSPEPQPGPVQTPAQWAVRWHGVALLLLLAAATPLLHFGWHVALGHEQPMRRTGAATAAPAWHTDTFLDGSWAQALERWLLEDSPVAWTLRGIYNELRWRLGLLQTDRVLVGRGGWLFMRQSCWPDAGRLERERDGRMQLLARIRGDADALGVGLVAMVVPDKERVYPEFAYGDAAVPEGKAGVYDLVLDELRRAGIAAIDLRAALTDAKTPGGPLLYQPMDTHWSAQGALVAGRASAAALLDGPFADRLGPEWQVQLAGPNRVEVLSDLVGMIGMRTTVRWHEELGLWLNRPASGMTFDLLAAFDYYAIDVRDPQAPDRLLPMAGFAARAPVALAGSSFSLTNGATALAFGLRRPVDARGVHTGANALQGLAATFDRVRRGECTARVVVWEFVERAWAEGLGAERWPPSR